jgi:hypothetical protein
MHQVKFGEHTIVVLPDIYALRGAYAEFSKKRLEANEAIMIIAYYDTVDGVKHFLWELEVDVEKHDSDGSLVVIDGLKEFYQSETNFLHHLALIGEKIKSSGKQGISVIIDMGLFFHGHKEDLVEFERSMSVKGDFTCKALLCCYNAADFRTLTESAQIDISGLHHRKIKA